MSSPQYESDFLRFDLHFPEDLPSDSSIPAQRSDELAKQAMLLEFAVNSATCVYSPNDRTDIWTSALAPTIAQHPIGSLPIGQEDAAETRTIIAYSFNERAASHRYSQTEVMDIFEGLVAFEQSPLTQIVASALEQTPDETLIQNPVNQLRPGNNAAPYKASDEISGEDVVVKVGLEVFDENANRDKSALTNLYRWLGLTAAIGLPGFEQPVAFSAEQPVTVTQFVPGFELLDIAGFDIKPQPSEESLEAYAYGLYESIVRNIGLDVHRRDILYEPDTDTLTNIDFVKLHPTLVGRKEYYNAIVTRLVNTFVSSFGPEFDAVSFRSLLEEFSEQGQYDLKQKTATL